MMTDTMTLTLAQDTNGQGALESIAGTFEAMITKLNILHHPDDLLAMLSEVSLVLAGVFVVVGLLCVFNGYRWHRWVVVILAAMAGFMLGGVMTKHVGQSSVVAVSLGLLCAMVAMPMLKIAVALFGGLTGAFIGANVWTAMGESVPDAHWAGAAMGFIIMAMASFMLFRLVVVTFTSIGGAALVLFGTIALLLHNPSWAPAVKDHLSNHNMLVPLLLAVAAVGGFVIQQGRVQADAKAAA